MLKQIVNAEGVEKLTKEQQKRVIGGLKDCLLPNGICRLIEVTCAELQCRPMP